MSVLEEKIAELRSKTIDIYRNKKCGNCKYFSPMNERCMLLDFHTKNMKNQLCDNPELVVSLLLGKKS